VDFLSSQKHTVLMASWGPGVVSLGDGGVRHDLPVNRWRRGTWLQRWRNGWRWLDTRVTSRYFVTLPFTALLLMTTGLAAVSA
jgi:hypothetical protein